MKVGFHANVCDQSTSYISRALYKPFKELAAILEADYGGIIEHLWIDIELIERERKALNFRFQKRVSGYSRLGLPAIPDNFNVGHYSVKTRFSSTSFPRFRTSSHLRS